MVLMGVRVTATFSAAGSYVPPTVIEVELTASGLTWGRGPVRDTHSSFKAMVERDGQWVEAVAFTYKRDLKKEKSEDFEDTETWKRIRAAWSAKTGKPAPYARVPDVALVSPKMSKARTTGWFATNVKKRYESCRSRVPAL